MVSNSSLARSQAPSQRTAWGRLKTFIQRDSTQGYILIAPALIILLLLLAYPFLLGLYMSLTEWPVGGEPTFVGFEHFVKNWESSTFRLAVANTVLYTFVSVACKLVLGFGVALLLNQEFVGRRFVRAAVLLPWIVPIVLSAQAWKWMFDPNLSALNWILRELGLSEVPWLSDPTWARISVITVNIWRGLPFYAINFLAGLQTVPQELYEAAAIDGAGRIGRLLHVTIPMLLPVIIVVVLISTIGTISDFGVVWSLTGGGPAHATEVLATYSYVVGLRAGFLGRGASVSLTMFPLLLMLVFLNLYYVRRRVET